MYIYKNIQVSSTSNESASDKSRREIRNILLVQWRFSIYLAVYEIIWKKNIVEPYRPHTWEYNKAQALSMLDNQGYKETFRICSLISFPS